jgi:hypothetical protein
VLCEFVVGGGVLHFILALLFVNKHLQVFHSFLVVQCFFAGVYSVRCIFPATSSVFTFLSFCSAPVLDFLRLRLLLPFVEGVCVYFSVNFLCLA